MAVMVAVVALAGVVWLLSRVLGGWSGVLRRAVVGVVALVLVSGLLTGTVSCG